MFRYLFWFVLKDKKTSYDECLAHIGDFGLLKDIKYAFLSSMMSKGLQRNLVALKLFCIDKDLFIKFDANKALKYG